METTKKKCFYTATYHLPYDSILRSFTIKDFVVDKDGFIRIFENGKYKILIANDTNGKINKFIYRSEEELLFTEVNLDGCNEFKEIVDYEFNMFYCVSEQNECKDFQIDTNKIDEESLKVIGECVNRIHIAFCGLRNFISQSDKIEFERLETHVNIYDFDSKLKFQPALNFVVEAKSMVMGIISPILSCQKVISVLKVNKDNIDEYVRRFLIIEKLSIDPVLTLITLYALYEYITNTNSHLRELLQSNKKIGCNVNLLKKFRGTRNLVAHGVVDRSDTKDILKEFLGDVEPESSAYSFDRYKPSHMKLVNEVISEVQPVIQKYLREELGIES